MIAEKLLVTFHYLEWPCPWGMRRVTGRNLPIQGVNSTCNQMFESPGDLTLSDLGLKCEKDA